ncbi:MAG: sensor histidine kinase [Candidatus Nanopelagicales bacterium]
MRRDLPIALLALAAGVAAALLVLAGDESPEPAAASAAVTVMVGWAFIGSGLAARRQRPENRLGILMVLIGFAWFATFLVEAEATVPATIGEALGSVYLAGFVLLVLAFPTGRLRGRLDRALVAAAVVLVTVVQVAWLAAEGGVADAILQAQRAAGVVLSLFTVALLVRRWARASAPERRAVAPVLWVASAMFAALAVSVANDILGEPLGDAPVWTQQLVFACIPVAVLAVLVRRRLARGAVAGLVVELGGPAAPADLHLRDALARALGDPSLEVAYWVPASGRYVGADGSPLRLPEPGREDRASTVVERDGAPVAALIHDPALSDEGDLVRSVCAAAGLTLENARLQADLRARLAELQASRARLVEATDAERRRIERDLHDGTQQRLVAIAMALGLAESRLAADPSAAGPLLGEARRDLVDAMRELRELTQGIRPALLVERGLGAALEGMAARAALPVRAEVDVPGRLPEQVEGAAWFVASEALANAAKHSHAAEVRLAASVHEGVLVLEVADDGIGGAAAGGGSGLRGLADRVEALGGRLTVSSPPGRGSTLRAEIPCG